MAGTRRDEDANAAVIALTQRLMRGCERLRLCANGCVLRRAAENSETIYYNEDRATKALSRANKSTLPKEGIEPSPCRQDGIVNPAHEKCNDLQNKALTDSSLSVLASCLAHVVQKYPDLRELVEAGQTCRSISRRQSRRL